MGIIRIGEIGEERTSLFVRRRHVLTELNPYVSST